MRATGIRHNDQNGNGKPTERMLETLCNDIVNTCSRKGFTTAAHKLTGSAIKIGLHMSSFRIDTKMLGHNGRISQWCKSPKGYKRTDVPTWDQRVEFNDLINKLFDSYHFIANIKSGPFTVRSKVKGSFTENDWIYIQPDYSRQDEILPENDARAQCNSDALEASHRLTTRSKRKEQARAYRERLKLFNGARRVVVAGFYDYGNRTISGKPTTKNGKLMTHHQFYTMLEKLNSYEQRRVKAASIAETVRMASQPGLRLVGAA